MKHIRNLAVILVAAAIVIAPVAIPFAVGAQTRGGDSSDTTFDDSQAVIKNPLKWGGIFQFLEQAINNVVIPIAAVASVFLLIWTGFKMVMAQGEPAKLTAAKKSFMNVIWGMLIIFGSWAIALAVKGTIDQLIK